MNIKTWFTNKNFLKKMIYIYVIFAVVPMISVTIYNYNQTKHLLLNQEYADIQQNAETIESGILSKFYPYETIVSELRSDKVLNIYLNMDYTELSYGDLAYYSRTSLDKILILYPEIKWLRFYSNNDTLPDDNYYFLPLDKVNENVLHEADDMRGLPIVSGSLLDESENEILFIANMNYYGSKMSQNYIALGIYQKAVQELLIQKKQGKEAYLLDQEGNILACSKDSMVGCDFSQEIIKWSNISEDKIVDITNVDGDALLCFKKNIGTNMTLILTTDRDMLLKEVKKTPKITATIFLIVTIISILVVLGVNKSVSQRLDKIVYATEKIGQGKFDYILDEEGQDEFGRIAKAINNMNHKIDMLIQENYERKIKMKTSEMNLLQEQINPHFLYNALAVVSSVSLREGAKKTGQSIRYLADFYRATLSKGKQVITVQEEIALLENYMKIQQLRFLDMLQISYHIDSQILSCNMLKLILQPLVENAIHHGQREEEILHIKVSGFCKNNRLCFAVEDDGVGMEKEQLEKLRNDLRVQQEGFGLKNVDIRIKLHYGTEYGVEIFSEHNKGTKICVEIPQC